MDINNTKNINVVISFIKYLEKNGFPYKNYNANVSFPYKKNSTSKYNNPFTKKYNIHLLKNNYLGSNNIHQNELKKSNDNSNNNSNNNKKTLKDSLLFISKLQQYINRYAESYITGGLAIKLYLNTDTQNTNTHNINILKTNDIDMLLVHNVENNNITITNIHKYLKLTDFILKSINYKDYNKKTVLQIYSLCAFENTDMFKDIVKIVLLNGYDLYTYKPKIERNVYTFRFLKKITDNFYVKFIVKFNDPEIVYKENKIGYCKMSLYYKDKINRVKQYIYPVEFIVLDKNKIKTDLFKGSVTINGNKYQLYNERFLIYNLMLLYYRYKSNYIDKANHTIEKKKAEGKNIRDEKRLDYMIRYYLKKYYNPTNNQVKDIIQKIKDNSYKFSKYMLSINNKNLNIIDNLIKEIISK